MFTWDEASEVEFFRTLLRFRTVSTEGPTNGEYHACSLWLQTACEDLGLSTSLLEPVAGRPVVVASLLGSEPELPAVVLNSHYDVVPAMEEHWHVDPWAAIEKEGRIYGRGAQDMKCVVAAYILALRRLLAARKGVPFRRTLHLTFVPDEEIGGKDGMGAFLQSTTFQQLGEVGVALDEGLASPTPVTTVFYGERAPMWIVVHANGPTGHGSRFIPDTAVSKLIGIANKALAFRAEQEAALGWGKGCAHCEAKKLGDVTTLNLTMLDAGVSMDGGTTYSLNVIPITAKAGFDIRVAPTTPIEDIRKMLDEWCAEEGLSWDFAPWTSPATAHHVSSIDEKQNPWWGIFKGACDKAGLEIEPEIFPAGTDSRFIRALGIPAFGFSPLANSPILLHEHNEYVDKQVFLDGIKVYEELIPALCDASKLHTEQPVAAGSKRMKGIGGGHCQPCAPVSES